MDNGYSLHHNISQSYIPEDQGYYRIIGASHKTYFRCPVLDIKCYNDKYSLHPLSRSNMLGLSSMYTSMDLLFGL